MTIVLRTVKYKSWSSEEQVFQVFSSIVTEYSYFKNSPQEELQVSGVNISLLNKPVFLKATTYLKEYHLSIK